MTKDIIQFFKDLNNFETAIAIVLAIAVPIIGFLLRKIFSKKSPKNNTTKNKIEKSEIEGDAIQGRDHIKVDKSTHHHYYEKQKKNLPNLIISKRKEGQYKQLEFYNNGTEALTNLDIKIHGSQQKPQFIKANEKQMFATPHECETIHTNERKILINLPDKVSIKVSAVGTKSRHKFETEGFFDFSDHMS